MKHPESLLPQWVNEERLQLPVADSLHVPAHPAPAVEVAIGQLNTQEEIRARSHVLTEQRIEGSTRDERLAFVDKAQPHAVHDFMAISSGPDVLSNPYFHSSSFARNIVGHISDFAKFAKEKDLAPVVSWSYDPYTNDRASGQGEKRFHAHFVGRTEQEVATVHEIARPLGELALTRQRRIADEFATVGSWALYDSLQHTPLPGITLIEPGSTDLSYVGMQFSFNGGWQTMESNVEDIANSLMSIDFAYHQLFENFVRGLTRGTYGHWERPKFIADAEEYAYDIADSNRLRPETAKLIGRFISKLQPSLLNDAATARFKASPNDEMTAHIYPLGGISYTTCISEIDGTPRGHIRPNMFTDLGGAGVALVDGITTKTKKTKAPMSEAEVRKRHDFQQDFISSIS